MTSSKILTIDKIMNITDVSAYLNELSVYIKDKYPDKDPEYIYYQLDRYGVNKRDVERVCNGLLFLTNLKSDIVVPKIPTLPEPDSKHTIKDDRDEKALVFRLDKNGYTIMPEDLKLVKNQGFMQKYLVMKGQGLPSPQIQQQMMMDGVDVNLWENLEANYEEFYNSKFTTSNGTDVTYYVNLLASGEEIDNLIKLMLAHKVDPSILLDIENVSTFLSDQEKELFTSYQLKFDEEYANRLAAEERTLEVVKTQTEQDYDEIARKILNKIENHKIDKCKTTKCLYCDSEDLNHIPSECPSKRRIPCKYCGIKFPQHDPKDCAMKDQWYDFYDQYSHLFPDNDTNSSINVNKMTKLEPGDKGVIHVENFTYYITMYKRCIKTPVGGVYEPTMIKLLKQANFLKLGMMGNPRVDAFFAVSEKHKCRILDVDVVDNGQSWFLFHDENQAIFVVDKEQAQIILDDTKYLVTLNNAMDMKWIRNAGCSYSGQMIDAEVLFNVLYSTRGLYATFDYFGFTYVKHIKRKQKDTTKEDSLKEVELLFKAYHKALVDAKSSPFRDYVFL